MPTALDYAGGEVPEWVEYNSLRPIVEGTQTSSSYPEIYGAYMDLQRMIRVDDYKLIVYPYAGVKRLFNLADDPQEMHDLAADVQQSERVDGIFARLQELMVEMNDTLHLADFFP